MIETAKAILERGDPVLIFPEGTRTRPGALGKPKRGVGRLALETGATVVPVAIIGTEDDPQGLPHPPAQGPRADRRAAELPAGGVGHRPARRGRHRPHLAERDAPVGVARRPAAARGAPRSSAAARGAPRSRSCSPAPASRSTSAAARKRPGRPDRRDARERALPARRRRSRAASSAVKAAELELGRHDLVAFAVPAAELPAGARRARAQARPAHGRARRCSQGPRAAARHAPVAPTSPSARTSWAVGVLGGPAHAADALSDGASLVLATHGRRASPARSRTRCRRRAAGHAHHGRRRRGARGLRQERRRARRRGRARRPERRGRRGRQGVRRDATRSRAATARSPETFAGLAGTGDLVATVLAEGSRNRRAGELLAQGDARRRDRRRARPDRRGGRRRSRCSPPGSRQAGVDAPVLRGLAGIIEGNVEPDRWTARR